MSFNVNVDLRMDSYGPIHYNGHWITYGIMIDEWSMRCTSCGEELSGSTAELHKVDGEREPYFWIYKLKKFDECENKKDTWYEAIMENVMLEHRGKVADASTRVAIKKQIENEMMVGPVDASVDFEYNQKT